MSKSDFKQSMSTFVVRIWREWSTGGPRWRGNIEHLETKKRSGFLDFESMLGFLHSFDIFKDKDKDDDAMEI